jgi:ArsR family transcriptional regulator, arsenate/arsenite/antimonite-responsive transcriptional repressor
MNGEAYEKELEEFFMALADKTRLRILNLMTEGEICVAYFTEVLGDSQPKVSRHLAYLRNAGIVKTRRDGKWIYYSIRWPADDGTHAVLRTTLSAMGSDRDLIADRAKYRDLSATSDNTYAQTDVYVQTSRNHNALDEFLL